MNSRSYIQGFSDGLRAMESTLSSGSSGNLTKSAAPGGLDLLAQVLKGTLYRGGKFIKRHPVLTAGTGYAGYKILEDESNPWWYRNLQSGSLEDRLFDKYFNGAGYRTLTGNEVNELGLV